MKKIFFLLALVFAGYLSMGQKTDKKLQAKLEDVIKGFNGDIGIYVKNLNSGKIVAINADTVFPTASIVKVPILTGIMDKIRRGELDYDQELLYRDSLSYAEYDVSGRLKDSTKIALKKVIMLMLTTSDNTASLWLQSLAGKGARINELLDSLGFKDTRVNSRTPGREKIREIYGWGQTTPKEIGTIFERIYRNQLFIPALCDRMMRCLGRNYWDENEAISMVPPYIEVFSKNGCVNQVRSEVLLVNAPHNPYVFCIFTKNNKDISWTHANEAWTMARKLSALLWEYFEPGDNWVAPVN
jgi:beta-lactamase class A